MALSVDGRQLLNYRENKFDIKARYSGVSVMNIDGSNSRDTGQGCFGRALSLDGRLIVFSTYELEIGDGNKDALMVL